VVSKTLQSFHQRGIAKIKECHHHSPFNREGGILQFIIEQIPYIETVGTRFEVLPQVPQKPFNSFPAKVSINHEAALK
jgi:hypothetical protein